MILHGPDRVVECHAECEVGDVNVGGIEPPPSVTLCEQSRWIADDEQLRPYMLNEPRGGVPVFQREPGRALNRVGFTVCDYGGGISVSVARLL